MKALAENCSEENTKSREEALRCLDIADLKALKSYFMGLII